MKNSSPLRIKLQTAVVISLLILSTLIVGCASLMKRGLLPELTGRQPPDVELGQKLILFDNPPIISSGLIDKNGTAHVFVVDKASRLNHIEIFADKITKREFVGRINTNKTEHIDTIEHPPGKIRVLAGNKQFFQVSPDQEWQEIKGNRCTRFVPVGTELFCAFVAKGEEIGTPERNDYTYGLFIFLPFFYWSHEHADKIVLAQESQYGWVVRAVVDPDTFLDAENDFMVGTDSFGNIHFLYHTTKGGLGYFAVPGWGSGSTHEIPPESELRYAKLTFDQLLAYSRYIQNQPSSNNSEPLQWVTVKGSPLTDKPCQKDSHHNGSQIRPIRQMFSINNTTGEVNGLMLTRGGCTLENGQRQLTLKHKDSLWVEVTLRDGQWSPHFNIVTAKDFPNSNYDWYDAYPSQHGRFIIDTAPKWNKHLLLRSYESRSWHMNYLVKVDHLEWSLPLILGSSHRVNLTNLITVNNSGDAFVAWVNKKGKFIGRWVKATTDNKK